MEILRIENLSFKYPKAEAKALDSIKLSVESGEFIVVCGESGCGKTTLLRLLKKQLAPVGEKSGSIYYNGREQALLDKKTDAAEIGYVFQNPDNQIVTDKVWHELAFGLESLGVTTEIIRRRVAETASYFGIQEWFRKKTDELSGGQKQLLNLAAITVMQPKILILDEPTSQLDPIAASDFIAVLQRLNHELGITVILAEHRLEELFPTADKVLLMEKGKTLLYAPPKEISEKLKKLQSKHPMLSALPSAVRIFNALDINAECPLTVKEGKAFLERHFTADSLSWDSKPYLHSEETAIELKNVWFRYEKSLPDILRGISLKIYKGEIFSVLGGNGSGKTTMLNVISALNKAYRGKLFINGKQLKEYKSNSLYRGCLAYLPQNPQSVFVKDSVREDMNTLLEAFKVPKKDREEKIRSISEKIGISHLTDKHPYDLSGGEQQKCALAKILLSSPKILLLDEPTKGLDAFSKLGLKALLQELKNSGITVLSVTHDLEFAAESSDRCALFFDGEILSADIPSRFFSENNYYTTAASRMTRELWQGIITCGQVIEKCKGEDAK